MVEKAVYNELSNQCSKLENRCISLEIKLQQRKEIFQNNRPPLNQNAPEFQDFFQINELQARLEAKNVLIAKLKEHVVNIKGKNVVESVQSVHNLNVVTSNVYKVDLQPLSHCKKNKRDAHIDYFKVTQERTDTLRGIVKQARALKPFDNLLDYACKYAKRFQELIVCVCASCPSSKYVSKKLVAVTPMNITRKVRFAEPSKTSKDKTYTQVTSQEKQTTNNYVSASIGVSSSTKASRSKPMSNTKFAKSKKKKMWKPTGKVYTDVGYRFGNDQIAKIIGYGDYHLRNVTISRFYYVEGLGHNLFSADGADLLSGSRDINLYTISLYDVLKSSPVCLLSKASKTKSWLWHRQLSHLNFDTLNQLAKQGKSKKSSHKPKAYDTNQEKLYLLHMDLCGSMRVKSINGKKYILVIVNDYSRFMWVKFLRSKDEAPKNGAVERRNRTLVEAARTILIFSKAPLYLWAEIISTTWYTQNRSLTRLHYNKTPYELHEKKPDLSFLHIFGLLCYPTNDSEDLGKLKSKADIGIILVMLLQIRLFESTTTELDIS
ncbi:retrovirus-related pol polyprotein from transposon TNT 1-94 [Tanacetum coccineum]